MAKGEVVPRAAAPKIESTAIDRKRSDSSLKLVYFEGLCDICVEIISRITVALPFTF